MFKDQATASAPPPIRNQNIGRWAWVALWIMAFSASTAKGDPAVLDFEDLSPGTTVTAQYSPRGVLFLNHFLGTDPSAHSGTRVLRTADPAAEIFTPIPLAMTFASARSRVKLFAASTQIPLNGTLTAFDAADNVVAQEGPKPVAANVFTTMFEVTDPDATPSITRVELRLENGIHFAIDDLEFEGAAPTPDTATVLDFEDTAAGTTLTTQFDSRGVLFLQAFVETDPAAHSGTRVLRSVPPGTEIFTPQPFVITFTTAQARVKLFAGSQFAPLDGTLTAFDSGGNVVATDGPRLVPQNTFTTAFQVTVATASITRVEFQLEDTAFASIDDLEFGGGGETFFDQSFYIRALGARCLDFGAQASWAVGGPVIIHSCNGTVAQQVRVKEIDNSHDVELRVQAIFCIGVRGGQVAPGRPLELQACNGSPAQRFALDGDAILIGTQSSGPVTREYVIEPERDYTPSGTPLVVGTRELSDAEYFRFQAVDGSAARPTAGFVTVSKEVWLNWALSLGWGTVIEIDDRQPLELTEPMLKEIRSGITLRGYRKHTYQGPEIYTCTNTAGFMITQGPAAKGSISSAGTTVTLTPNDGDPTFEAIFRPGDLIRASGQMRRVTNINSQTSLNVTEPFVPDLPAGTAYERQDNVRVTGLRLRGPMGDPRCPNAELKEGASAILITETKDTEPRVLIDHLDISYWTGSAVDVRGTDHVAPDDDDNPSKDCPQPAWGFPRKTPVQAVGNFVHHNRAYGVVTGQGTFAAIQGNIFYRQHAHSIASDPTRNTGYLAYDNFVLSQTRTIDVDAHGSLCRNKCCNFLWWDCHHWVGGVSGDYYDVAWNTFLPTGHANFNQRGTPCRRTLIHNNRFLQSEDSAIITRTEDRENKHKTADNTFSASPSPTSDLAVGDFDGDGVDDVFVGTGAAWYFSSGGRAEWRFLNRMPEHASALRFGDFDFDLRTDVLALHDAHLDVSWGGVSPWKTINITAWKLEDLAVGDFDGDRHADLFLATGSEWFYAPGGKNWTPFAHSSYRTPQLRFGDFTKDGKTDVLGVVGGQWKIVRGGDFPDAKWQEHGPARTDSLTGLVVADFNGDGFADVAKTVPSRWLFSSHGTADWSVLRSASTSLALQPIGRFDHDATSDVILWDGRHFDYAPSGRNPLANLSRQDMR